MIQCLLQNEMQREGAEGRVKTYGELILPVWNPFDRCPGNGEQRRNKGIDTDRKPERCMHFQIWRDKQSRCSKIKNRNRSTVNLLIIWEGRGEEWLINTTEKNATRDHKNKENMVNEMSVVWQEYKHGQMNYQPQKMRTYQTTNAKRPWHWVKENQPLLSLDIHFRPVTQRGKNWVIGKCHINTKNNEVQELLDKIQKDKKEIYLKDN